MVEDHEGMKPSDLKQRALRGVTWSAIAGGGAQVLAFVFFILISRAVGPEAFGAVAVSLLLIELAKVFCCDCVAVNLIADGAFQKTRFNAAFVLSISLSILISLLLSVLAPILGSVLGISALSYVLPQIAPILPLLSATRLFEAELVLRMEFRPVAMRSLAGALLGGGAGVIAAYMHQGVEALILQQWVAALTSLLLLGAQADWRPGAQFTAAEFVKLTRQSAAISPANLIASLRQIFDGMAIAWFSGAATVGVYNFAKRTRLALQLGLSGAITRVSLPTFAHVKDTPERLASALNQSLGLTAVAVFPIFIGIGAIAPELIEVFLGPRWADAAWPLTLLMIGGAMAITTRLSENVLLICDKRGAIIVINAIALALLTLAIALTGRYGPIAIAAAVLVEGILHEIAVWAVASRVTPYLRLREYLARVWVPMAMCLAMLVLIAVTREIGFGAYLPAFVRLIALVLLGAAFYCAAVWLFARTAFENLISAARVIAAKPLE
jgi:O-antigen/teichoic acid export membrane protein